MTLSAGQRASETFVGYRDPPENYMGRNLNSQKGSYRDYLGD